jgi:hypothetical protein
MQPCDKLCPLLIHAGAQGRTVEPILATELMIVISALLAFHLRDFSRADLSGEAREHG